MESVLAGYPDPEPRVKIVERGECSDVEFFSQMEMLHARLSERNPLMTADSSEHLPTAAEIASDSLDGRYAIRHFHGKTLAEAEQILQRAVGIPFRSPTPKT